MTTPDADARRNRWAFGVGTLGRDMAYTLTSMFLIVYLTEVLDLPDAVMWWCNVWLLVARLLDAFDDVFMGALIDNTRTRWGQYKPWIAGGALASAVLTVVMFTDTGLRDLGYVPIFAAVYVLWGIAYSINDIPYWSLLPALSLDQKERERIGSLAKVFATLGLFSVVVTILPVTSALGGGPAAWTTYATAVVVVLVLGQLVTLVGVREPGFVVAQERTGLRELWAVVTRNDQLMWTVLSMVLFLTGYITTTAFGVYFFKYAYRDEAMYSPFAAVLGVGQLLGFGLFPVARRRFTRRGLYTFAIGLITVGYAVFFFSPMQIVPIALAGLLLFVGQSFIVILTLVFITDCIEYGHWKLGRRNAAVTLALQPFINKASGAIATATVGVTVILTGINEAATPDDVTPGGLLGLKVMMMVVPLVLILAGYVVWRARYRIDEAFHARIVADLRARGELG